MNRQRIRVIALVGLVVAAGAYVWAQRSASTVKPAPTTNAAVKKPGAVTPGAKPTAPAANPGAAAANAKTASAPLVPGSKGTAPAPGAASTSPATVPAKTPAAVPPPAAAAVNSKTLPPNAHGTPAVASAPAAPVPAAPVVLASWQDHLQKGAFLAERLKPRLPEGTDLMVASNGFRDLQQFVAAVTASDNLKLDFEELKRRVVTDGKGLAHAIDAMRKVASATIEEQRAEYEARGLIQEARRHPLPPAPAVKTAVKPQPKKPARTQSGI